MRLVNRKKSTLLQLVDLHIKATTENPINHIMATFLRSKPAVNDPEHEHKLKRLFCFKTMDKTTRRWVYFNVMASNKVKRPENVGQLARSFAGIVRTEDQLCVNFDFTPLHWCKDILGFDYVARIKLHREFYSTEMKTCRRKHDYIIQIMIRNYEDVMNYTGLQPLLGHKLDFDMSEYTILKNKRYIDPTPEEATLLGLIARQRSFVLRSKDRKFELDLTSTKTLTCTLKLTRLPRYIKLNDEFVEIWDPPIAEPLTQFRLPIKIDHKQRFTYEYCDEKRELKLIFKTVETLQP